MADMIFKKDWNTGAVMVSHWDEETDVSVKLLVQGDENIMARWQNQIWFNCANGRAVYRIVSQDNWRKTVHAVLIRGIMWANPS